MSQVVEELRKRRLDRGDGLRQAAKYLRISPSTLHRYEHAERIPDSTIIFRLASYYGMGPEELLRTIESAREKGGETHGKA